MIGSHCIKAWSKTQSVVAKSSAESELYGVVRGACEGLGLKTLLQDMGGLSDIRLHLDATAAQGILERSGISKVRHIGVNVLWLQEQCARKMVPLQKVPGADNPADLMTKHLSVATIVNHMNRMQLQFRDGRSGKAAKLHLVGHKVGNVGGGDLWSEKGECGRWVRVHRTPRNPCLHNSR